MITAKRKIALLQKLELISPRWTAALRAKKDNENIMTPTVGLDMMNTCRCIVGEAHDFTNDYELNGDKEYDETYDNAGECDECDAYCSTLVPLVYNISFPAIGVTESHKRKNSVAWIELEAFIKHFNEAHGN